MSSTSKECNLFLRSFPPSRQRYCRQTNLLCIRHESPLLACSCLGSARILNMVCRMEKNGVQPNTKTFTALIGSVGRMNTIDHAMEIIEQLLSPERDSTSLTQTYSALMSACEKAGQWDLAVALFDKMSARVSLPFLFTCYHGRLPCMQI